MNPNSFKLLSLGLILMYGHLIDYWTIDDNVMAL